MNLHFDETVYSGIGDKAILPTAVVTTSYYCLRREALL